MLVCRSEQASTAGSAQDRALRERRPRTRCSRRSTSTTSTRCRSCCAPRARRPRARTSRSRRAARAAGGRTSIRRADAASTVGDRAGRQVRAARRLLQVGDRGAHPRRHRRRGWTWRSSWSTPREIEAARRIAEWVDGILWPGGFGERGIEGKIEAVRYARRWWHPFPRHLPRMQLAVVEFARNVCGMEGELDRVRSRDPVPGRRPDARAEGGVRHGRDDEARRGPSACSRARGAHDLTTRRVIYKRHRHRYEVNNLPPPTWRTRGWSPAALSPDERLVEMIELPDHPFFLASSFTPAFLSPPPPPPLPSAFFWAPPRPPPAAPRPAVQERAGREGAAPGPGPPRLGPFVFASLSFPPPGRRLPAGTRTPATGGGTVSSSGARPRGSAAG